MSKNKQVPKKAKPKATVVRIKSGAFGRKIMTKTMPSLALSMVPAVFGDTNLFCIRFCMTRPETLTLAPAITKLKVRGNLDDNKTRF